MPENAPEAASLYGISLKLDQFIPLDDGYYLIGHTEWTDERVANVGVTLKAHDASGRELALEPYSGEDITIPENGRAFKVYGKVFDEDVRLAASECIWSILSLLSLPLTCAPSVSLSMTPNLTCPIKLVVAIAGGCAGAERLQLASATYRQNSATCAALIWPSKPTALEIAWRHYQ